MCQCNACKSKANGLHQEYELLPEFESLLSGRNYEMYGNGNDFGINREAPKSINKYNTDLDAPFFGGNFNFRYTGGDNQAFVTFNTVMSYRKKYPDAEKRKLEQRLIEAGKAWDSAAQLQVRDVNGAYPTKITLRFEVKIVRDGKHANKNTDVQPPGATSVWIFGKDREMVSRDLNIFIGSTRDVLVHELGHVWGLKDEYSTKWYEELSPSHVGSDSPLLKDKIAIMNEGVFEPAGRGEFRGRYFAHICRPLLS